LLSHDGMVEAIRLPRVVLTALLALLVGAPRGCNDSPTRWRFRTIGPYDNHEVVHVYSAMIGRPSDFNNEGLAVSFQADPGRSDLTVRFNGQQVQEACRGWPGRSCST